MQLFKGYIGRETKTTKITPPNDGLDDSNGKTAPSPPKLENYTFNTTSNVIFWPRQKYITNIYRKLIPTLHLIYQSDQKCNFC